MFNINLNKKIFWIVALLIILPNLLFTVYLYEKNKNLVQIRAIARADSLRDYFLSMRHVYHHQFLNSGIDINETTVGFLPAHASTLISDKFEEISKDGITMRNVTDRYRNPKNKADEFELEAIKYFKDNPDKNTLIKKINKNKKEIVNYASPLVIDKYCITCHGNKDEVLPSITKMYDDGYGYKIGDIRGVTSIKIPLENLRSETMDGFYEITVLSWISILFLLIIIYFAIKKLTIKDVEQKIFLQNEIKKKTADLEYQKDAVNKLSFYDMLTNLPNKKLFKQYLNKALDDSNKNLKYGAILFVDIDNFKNVNDAMGQDFGDEVLKEITDRLISNIHKVSIVSRQESDKFLVLLENISKNEDESAILAKETAQYIQNIFQEPFITQNKSFYLTCSIGIVLYLNHNNDANILIERAEYAMRTAKSAGKNIISFFDESLQDMTKSRSLMLQQIKEAVLTNQFFLHYQKQVDINEKAVGVEALIRWKHPALGLIPPSEFIPIAEESTIIKEIGSFVLNSAAKELVRWKEDEIKREWRISVNVSPLQFREERFIDELHELIVSYNINPAKLRVELTEGVLIVNQNEAMEKIDKLSQMGVSTSIDDFGTGYSSLAYLKHLKINELKIDQSFVFGLETNNSDKTIIKTIIMMGEEFGFEVIAEGVETKEQFETLKNLGCKYFQGYLFAKPCIESEL